MRSMKPWYRHGPRSGSPSLNYNGEWQEDADSMSTKSCSNVSSSSASAIGSEEKEQVISVSVVDCQQSGGILINGSDEDANSATHSTSINGTGGNFHQSDSRGNDDGKKYHNNNRNNNQHYFESGGGGYGQYNNNGSKRNNLNNHRQYGNNGGYGYNNQRRQYNNSFNYNFRNYNNATNNGRRQYQQHNEFYQSNYHHNNGNNGGYYNRGNGPRTHQEGYNNYRRHNNQGNNGGTPLSSPEFEESNLPWPAKRSNWSHGGYSYDGGPRQHYYSPNSRNCSPDASPTSDISGSFPVTGQTRDIVLNNGSVIHAQSLGQYDFFVGNLQNQQNGITGFPYSAYAHGNFYYNYGAPAASERDNSSTENTPSVQVMGPPPPPSESNSSSRAESCTASPAAEKTTEWPDDCTDCSDSESVHTSASTRCHSPEEFTDLPILTNDASCRFYNNFALFPKDISPNSTFCLRMPNKRSGYSFPIEWFEDLEPDEIVKQFSKVVDCSEKPFTFAVESSFSELDVAIWGKFVENQQTIDTFRKKVELWRDVYRLVRYMNFTPGFKHDPRNFPFFGLQVVGSTMSGFGSNTSDVDMCLVIRDTEVDQRFEAVDRLQTLSQTLNSLPFVENVEMIYAKVPILKFRDSTRRLDVDLNCNNFVGIRNTHLLYAYAQMDWRLKPLVLIVKLWAQFHRINDAKMMTVSSYSLVLMVIHFLQHGVEEPVLPNLQAEYPEKFNNKTPIIAVKIHEVMPPWQSKNTMGLGELLIHFLEYYARKFDYTRHVISVRSGGTIPIRLAANFKSVKNDFHQWKLLCVEEPFDRTNTARSVYDKLIFERIIAIFYASWQRLLVSQVLDSIFTPISEEDLRQISIAVANRLRC